MSFSHLLANYQPTVNLANITSTDSQDEVVRVRTTLEINSFDLATLEQYLIQDAYIPVSPVSIEEDDIKNATYRLYERYLDEAPDFPNNSRLAELFDPYPHDDTPVYEGFNGTKAAQEDDKHERELAKFNAVKDLIRILATRNIQATKAAEEEASATEQGKTRTVEEQMAFERRKNESLEKYIKKLNKKYEAVKLLVDERKAHKVHAIKIKSRRRPRRSKDYEWMAGKRLAKAEARKKQKVSILGAPTGPRAMRRQMTGHLL